MSNPAARWDERYAAGSPWPAGPNATVRDLVAPLTPGRARDVACGDGRHAIWLAGLGWQVDAVDFSAVAIARGRARADQLAADGVLPGQVRWSVADVSQDVPEPRSADLVLLAYVHLLPAQAVATLERSASAVAPGGLLLLVGHDRSNLHHGTGGPQRPEVLTDLDVVTHTLHESGLDVVRAEVLPREVEGAERAALDAVVVAQRPAATR
ncbi:class I SAM-dependent methyltransferase [Isoptericola sp. b441]|uniref:Class I SAM-dependent methyltransferase n=1 Tax=Actinotalea lenta TaxID=3064654 RepID=A0ABT9D6X1_9CELL|nr:MULTISPECIES: class I SAM-dependent methyltransferase [unclassified Isoptericola]MDO8106597.1 class I SAM-dependent methyltransferase [Isoptericola sp. b441]MDO8121695.1 class I SAM-dependent methyltransferase [Isoptericola sp. b490]